MDEPLSRPTASPDEPHSFVDSNELNQYVGRLLSSFNFSPSSNDALVDIVSPSASSIPLQENIECDFSTTEDFPSPLPAAAKVTSSLGLEMETPTNPQEGKLTPPSPDKVVDAALITTSGNFNGLNLSFELFF